MNRISDNVSEQLENAAEDVLQQLNPFDKLINAGVKYEQEKPKRKRRTKAEMQAARKQEQQEQNDINILKCDTDTHIIAIVEWDQDKNDTNILPSIVEVPDNILIDDYDNETISNWLSNKVGYCHKGFALDWPDNPSFDEFCQYEIEKAHLNNRQEPDFDYRLFYSPGEKVYLVRYYDNMQTKEMIYTTLRTVYPRAMVGVVNKYGCQCIGYSDRDNIFLNKQDADTYFTSINARIEDEIEETGKKKRRRNKQDEEDMSELEEE